VSNQKSIVSFLICAVCLPAPVFADSFLISDQVTANTTQIMNGDDEVGVVEPGGRINTSDDNKSGIFSTRAGASIINRGAINSTGFNSQGIYSDGVSASIINRGAINSTGSNSDGIYSDGVSASISNTGVIFTYGLGARGIRSFGTDAFIINSGNINTTGSGGFGIETGGSNAISINMGIIETVGESAYGIVSRGVNVGITNDGLISTTGFQATAIESTAQNAYITNNGVIKTTGRGSHGVDMASVDGRIINRGSIFTSGDGSIGVNSSTAKSTLFNFGEIKTSGDSLADAVVMSGADSVITNFGQITASGGSAYAILGGSGKQTLNIMPGSRITGRISLEGVGDNDEVIFFGSDGSASITIENSENIRILNSNATLIGNRIVYVDPTISAFSMRNLNSMTNATHSSVAQRFTVISPSGSMDQIKTNPTTPTEEKSTIWANTFIQRDQSDPEEHIQANESHLAGVVIGHERMDAVNPFGFLGGVARSDTSSSSNRRESDSFFLGAYGRHDAHSVQFTGSLLFGRREHQLHRQVLDNLNGSMTALGRTRGLFVSPSISISGTNSTLRSFGIQPSATITYSLERIKGYSETGADQNNFQFGDQKIEALSTRLQIEKTQIMSRGEFRVRAGVHSRNTRSRDVVSRTNGTEFKINSQPDDRAAGLFAGVQADIRMTGPLRLKLTAEYGELGGSAKFTNGSLIIFTPF
jgi:hypothetical protein